MPVHSQTNAMLIAAQSANIDEWLGEIVWNPTGGQTVNQVILQNADGTITQVTGTFTLDNGEVVGGTITGLQRRNELELWESVTGLSVDVDLFKAFLGNGLLLGGFLFTGNDTFSHLAPGSTAFAFGGADNVDLARNGHVYAAGGNDDIDALGVPGSTEDTVDYSVDALGQVNTRGMNIRLNTNSASFEYNAIGFAQDKQTLGSVENDQLAGINHVLATFGDDSVVGNIWFDTFDDPVGSSVWTFDGDDTIANAANVWAGSGDDRITLPLLAGGTFRGQSGNDVFVLNAVANDQEANIQGGAGKDTIDANMSLRFYIDLSLGVVTLSGAGANQVGTIIFGSIENLIGGDRNDSLIGVDGMNELQGEGGSDLLVGAGGDDELFGGDGNDELHGDSLNGIAIVPENQMGDDLLEGGGGADRLFGDGGADILSGQDGRDELHGGTGGDELKGGNGDDVLNGDGGSDSLFGGRHDDTLNGDGGADTLTGNQGRDLLDGGGGDDVLLAGTHNDRLFGQNGDDILKGGYGSDRLDGGRGNDALYGQNGPDNFVFAENYDADTAYDFVDDQDTILLNRNLGLDGMSVQEVIDTFASVNGAHTIFDFGGGDIFTVRFVNNSNLLVNDINLIG